MTDNKLTDNEIIKGLEDLIKCNNNVIDCDHCSLSMFFPRCPEQIGELALCLINRKDKELNRLQAEVKKANRTVAGLMYENDELKRLVRPTESEKRSIAEFSFKKGEAEAYKELVGLIKDEITDAIISNGTAIKERVEKHNVNRYEDNICVMCDGKVSALVGIEDFLDNILKELVGEDNG